MPLSRHIFKAPTRFYKTGVVFLAYLNGLQDHFTMVGGQQSARSTLHLAELFRLADAAGLLRDPELAAARMTGRDGDAGRRRLMRDLSNDRDLLAINSATVKQWTLEQPVEGCARAASPRSRRGATTFRRSGSPKAGSRARQRHCVSPASAAAACSRRPTRPAGSAALDDNKRAVDEAVGIGAGALVLVAGGLPEGSRDLAGRAKQVRDGLAALLACARAAKMPLAIEPLHPMYAADRACVNTLAQALDLCDELGEGARRRDRHLSCVVGPGPVAADRARRADAHPRASHLRLAGADAPHAARPRHDGRRRDRPPAIRAMVEATGYDDYIDVEIFSANNWWKRDPDEVLRICLERHQTVV